MPERIIKSLENQRAEFALASVTAANLNDYRGEYKSYVKNIPVLLKTNGLGNTLAFMRSKKRAAYDLLYQQFSEWLKKPECPCKTLLPGKDLLEFVISQPSPVYRHVTKELIALLTWMKRLADSMIED
ncbi:CRISPR-associated protein, Cmr5 family [Candidatus Moduliflexus flocculans]|uniref:CRISPR type III-B/RAMP module-associated protein Cmr5 n=1 Tax=Candidatus Moduliflexus flocculans TaxID=1499966 RepID=A0A081BLE1_9BACT|nr:CRISPR-associated protein, Cmr5 family [Candidatus Moduliflexus flocculans]